MMFLRVEQLGVPQRSHIGTDEPFGPGIGFGAVFHPGDFGREARADPLNFLSGRVLIIARCLLSGVKQTSQIRNQFRLLPLKALEFSVTRYEYVGAVWIISPSPQNIAKRTVTRAVATYPQKHLR
jgi:hypothetical protein